MFFPTMTMYVNKYGPVMLCCFLYYHLLAVLFVFYVEKKSVPLLTLVCFFSMKIFVTKNRNMLNLRAPFLRVQAGTTCFICFEVIYKKCLCLTT